MRAHFTVQCADVHPECARPVFDAVPVERAAAFGEQARDFRVRNLQRQALRACESLGDEIAPDEVVVGLVEQGPI